MINIKKPLISSILSESPVAQSEAKGEGIKHKSSNFVKNINSFLQNCSSSFRMKRTQTLGLRISIITGAMTGAILSGITIPQTTRAETFLDNGLTSDQAISMMNASSTEVVKKIKMMVTAYSSTPEQTDDTPFITASGKNVADGIVANNMLPFGSKVRIPELYGDKIFIVEDRMHQRKGKYQLDIWFPEYLQAKEFGAQITNIEILES